MSGLRGSVQPRRRLGSPLQGVRHTDVGGGRAALRFRILTDASGPFFTVVTEAEVESFAVREGSFRESMARPWMGEWFGWTMPLVE